MSTSDLVEHLDRVMRRVDAEMHRLMPVLDTQGIGPLGTITLHRLHSIAPAPVHLLVDAMGRDASQVSRVIGRLEAKGLLSKENSPEDKRVSVLTLTPAGKAHVAKVEATLSRVITEVFAPLSSCENEQLLVLLKKASR
ncbi:MAG: MarR family transcriptional regulator [Pseudomonadota bacterium]